MLLLAVVEAQACPLKATYYRDADLDGYGDVEDSRARCFRPWGYYGWSATPGDCDDADDTLATHCGDYAVWWGDPHVHTSLSNDGCEDPDNWCLPEGDEPAAYLVENIEASGLSWIAVTDHAEWDIYSRLDIGEAYDIWETAQDRVEAASAAGAVVFLGFEYTASFGHRTVLLDTDRACERWRPAGTPTGDYKAVLGLETYSEETDLGFTEASEFEAWMEAVSTLSGCDEVRWASWRHHTAYPIPKSANWSKADHRIDTDTVVEIASQHGSSECTDITMDGCDWHVDPDRHNATGATQTALSLGYPFGFIGGSDRHDAHPWSRGESPSHSGHFIDSDGDGTEDTPAAQTFTGAITGVLLDEGTALTRGTILDAIDARHTFAASWNFEGLRVVAVGADGAVWWPGDDVPLRTGPLRLDVDLADPDVTAWAYELVDPVDGSTSTDAVFTLSPGDVRYLRIRAWIDGEEHRIWASPWFGTYP